MLSMFLDLLEGRGTMEKAENKRKSLYEDQAKLGNFDELATQAAYNKDQVYLTWRTNGKNTCKECAKLNGKTQLVGDWEVFPPLHPNCRCRVEVTKVVLAAGSEEMLSWYTPRLDRIPTDTKPISNDSPIYVSERAGVIYNYGKIVAKKVTDNNGNTKWEALDKENPWHYVRQGQTDRKAVIDRLKWENERYRNTLAAKLGFEVAKDAAITIGTAGLNKVGTLLKVGEGVLEDLVTDSDLPGMGSISAEVLSGIVERYLSKSPYAGIPINLLYGVAIDQLIPTERAKEFERFKKNLQEAQEERKRAKERNTWEQN